MSIKRHRGAKSQASSAVSRPAESPRLPKLRFPEFSEEWTKGRIDWFLRRVGQPVEVDADTVYREIGVRSHGKGIFHKLAGKGAALGEKRVFWVEPNAFVVNIVFAWEQAIALTSANEIGFIASHRFPMFVGRDERSDTRFVREFFLKRRGKYLLELASPGGAGRNKTLGQSNFADLVVVWPDLPEQQKIADFLVAVDSRTALLRRRQSALKRFKRAMSQRIFAQELRFTNADGSAFPDWQVTRLDRVARRVTKKNSDESTSLVLTNSAVHGIVSQQDFFDKDIANEDNLSGYYIVEDGDFVYNPRISVSAPVGPIKRSRFARGVMSPLYTVFRFDAQNEQFFEQFFASSVWYKYLKTVANYGARHDRMAITTGDFMAMPLPYPHADEQQKIASFLSALDEKIDAQAREIEAMQRFKTGLLQQMFA